jgi:hypothetical protein
MHSRLFYGEWMHACASAAITPEAVRLVAGLAPLIRDPRLEAHSP